MSDKTVNDRTSANIPEQNRAELVFIVSQRAAIRREGQSDTSCRTIRYRRNASEFTSGFNIPHTNACLDEDTRESEPLVVRRKDNATGAQPGIGEFRRDGDEVIGDFSCGQVPKLDG